MIRENIQHADVVLLRNSDYNKTFYMLRLMNQIRSEELEVILFTQQVFLWNRYFNVYVLKFSLKQVVKLLIRKD